MTSREKLKLDFQEICIFSGTDFQLGLPCLAQCKIYVPWGLTTCCTIRYITYNMIYLHMGTISNKACTMLLLMLQSHPIYLIFEVRFHMYCTTFDNSYHVHTQAIAHCRL